MAVPTEMSLENEIADLGKELILKYPVARRNEAKGNDRERRSELISKIQMIMREMLEDVAKWKCPVLQVPVRNEWENCFFDERELYYENLHVFKSQSQVDNGMRMVCHMMTAPSWELGVLASSRGMVAGPVVLTLANGDLVDCSQRGGVSVPQNVLEVTTISTSATWVLIVEKDASFQRLATSEVANRLGPCILMTGKGFPDVNSRILVCKLWELLHIPILALVDADPHGFEIMCVYRFGSLAMSPYSGHLACPAVRWLGVHPADIRPLLLDSKPLSLNDLAKVRSLLKRPYVEANEKLKAQLEILLEGNVKAEIEGVTSISTNYMTDVYIRNKIHCKEYF